MSFALCLLCVSNRNRLESVTDDESDDVIEGRDTDNEADILRRCRAEDFETRQRRAFAASVLDQPEQLMMYAQSGHDVSPHRERTFNTIFCVIHVLTDGMGEIEHCWSASSLYDYNVWLRGR